MKKAALIIISLVCLSVFSFLYFELPFNLIRPVFHADAINRAAKHYDLDPLLITAIIKVESNFLRKARSHVGATGLMQLLPSTAKELAPELGYDNFENVDLEDPDTNIRFGTLYIKKLINSFDGNIVLALAAYNAGRTRVKLWYIQNPLIGIESVDIPYKETRNYVKKVIKTHRWLKKIHELKMLIGHNKNKT